MHPQNARSVAEKLGLVALTQLTIVADGNPVKHYKSLHLDQSTSSHHQFELVLDHDSLGSPENHDLKSAQKLLGKSIHITFAYKNIANSRERNFVGIITEVGLCRSHRNRGNVVLKGYSPTILLDGAPHIQSFGGAQPTALAAVVDTLVKQAWDNGTYKYQIDCANNANLSYSCQYEETHYNYMRRLADCYGEEFFYDGNTLHFGKLPSTDQPVRLAFGREVDNIKVAMKVLHVNSEYYGYNSSQHEKLSSGKSHVEHVSSLGKQAYERSSVFKAPSLKIAPIKAHTHKDIATAQQHLAGSRSVEVFTTSGTTTVPFLYPGCVVEMDMLQAESRDTSFFTKLMITSVSHEVDILGNYKGSFEAVGADTGFLPRQEYTLPKADAQVAEVLSNADPMGQGRVQVKMDWQQGDEQSEWIRVVMPDAGGTDRVNQNRGHVFIPETGDQVMVGFVHQHPDRPFVMGGIFHGGTGLGGNTDNRVKSIQTRSGHRIIFTEDESIVITDKSGNEIHLDTTGSNITITAPETMTLNCRNMFINVGENMTTNVGQNNSQAIGMNNTQSVGMMKTTTVMGDTNMFITGKLVEMIDGDVHSETKKERKEYAAEVEQHALQGSMHQNAKNTVKNNSGEKSNNF